ncbi:MAG: hypothetical protein R3A52_30475 [Polyangiales bacterium]
MSPREQSRQTETGAWMSRSSSMESGGAAGVVAARGGGAHGRRGFCAASQVMDEARHVEVYDRYLREKMGTVYPVTPSLKSLLGT